MSLKNNILKHLQNEYPRIVHKGEIGRLAILDWHYENENAGRRCRELENEGLIERILDKKGNVQYRCIPSALRPELLEKAKQQDLKLN